MPASTKTRLLSRHDVAPANSDDRILVYYGAADESTAMAETTWLDLAGAFD